MIKMKKNLSEKFGKVLFLFEIGCNVCVLTKGTYNVAVFRDRGDIAEKESGF